MKIVNKLDFILDEVRREAESLDDYGQLQIHIQKHAGDVGKTEVVKITSTRLTGPEPNVAATTIIFELIKSIQDAEETGQLTFSVKFNHGNANILQVQDFKVIS